MPLVRGSSQAAISENIRRLSHEIGISPHVKNRRQAIAIAESVARRGRADGGVVRGYDLGGIVEPQQQPQGLMPPPGMMPGAMPPPPGTANGVVPGAIPPTVTGQPMASGIPQNAAPPGIVQNAPVGPPGPMNPMTMPMAGAPQLAKGGVAPPIIKPDLSGIERTQLRKLHVGPIMSAVPGRTDNHRAMVPAGSYVLPAQHLASMGHGNSLAGMSLADKMFGGPYNTAATKMPRGGRGVPKAPGLGHMADGGAAAQGGEPELVPVDLSGGEYVIPPHVIEQRYGNLENGHRVLDSWVMDTRKKEIDTQRKLPPPAED